MFWNEQEINRFINILNIVKHKNKKKILLVRGHLSVVKELFKRNGLNKCLEANE